MRYPNGATNGDIGSATVQGWYVHSSVPFTAADGTGKPARHPPTVSVWFPQRVLVWWPSLGGPSDIDSQAPAARARRD